MSKYEKKVAGLFARNLRMYRQRAKLTQQNLADALDVTYVSEITRWELYNQVPRLHTILEICKILKISIADITKE